MKKQHLLWLLVGAVTIPSTFAQAVEHPAGKIRQWAVTATTTSATQVFTSSSGVGGQTVTNTSCSILVIHDTAGGPDVYFTIKSSSAAPTSGDEIYTLKAGESISLDIEATRISYISASATADVRIIATFPTP